MKCWVLILTAKETVNRDMRLFEFLYILLFSVLKIVYESEPPPEPGTLEH